MEKGEQFLLQGGKHGIEKWPIWGHVVESSPLAEAQITSLHVRIDGLLCAPVVISDPAVFIVIAQPAQPSEIHTSLLHIIF